MILFIAGALLVLALAQGYALVAVWNRHAIPKSPRLFTFLLVAAMTPTIFAEVGVGWLFLSSGENFLGVDLLLLCALFVGGEALTWLVFDVYSLYHVNRKYRQRMKAVEDARMEGGNGS